MTRQLSILFLLATLVMNASAANWYVRTNSVGGNTGVDWNNAWSPASVAWATVNVGDTLWCAGGNYSSPFQVGTNGTPSQPISIRRVRSTDTAPTSAAGWNAAFDSQVVLASQNNLYATGNQSVGNNIIFDGRIWQGMVVYFDTNTAPAFSMCPNSGTTASLQSNTIIRYVEMYGPTNLISKVAGQYGNIKEADAVRGDSGVSTEYILNLTLDHCWIHNTDELLHFKFVYGLNRSNCFFGDITYTGSSSDAHPDFEYYGGGCGSTLAMWNIFSNCAGDGFFHSNGTYTNETFTGNLFVNWNQYEFYYYPGAVQGPLTFINNTCASYGTAWGGAYGGFIGGGGSPLTNSVVENNIFDISAAFGGQGSTGSFAQGTEDYNYYVTGTTIGSGAHDLTGARPFVGGTNATSFQITTNFTCYNSGAVFGSPTNTDMLGVTGNSVGAYQVALQAIAKFIFTGLRNN